MGEAELIRLRSLCKLRRQAASSQIVLPVSKVEQLLTIAQRALPLETAARELVSFAMTEQETNPRDWRVRLWARMHAVADAFGSPLVVPLARLQMAAAARRVLDRAREKSRPRRRKESA